MKKLSYRMFLDDLREPTSSDMVVVRSSSEAEQYVEQNGCPEFISFDHDLGGDDIAMIFVKWLVNKDLDLGGTFIPSNFVFNVHSANPQGAANIQSYLDNYLKFKEDNVVQES